MYGLGESFFSKRIGKKTWVERRRDHIQSVLKKSFLLIKLLKMY